MGELRKFQTMETSVLSPYLRLWVWRHWYPNVIWGAEPQQDQKTDNSSYRACPQETSLSYAATVQIGLASHR